MLYKSLYLSGLKRSQWRLCRSHSSFSDWKQSYFSCKQPKLLPKIWKKKKKECFGERESSDSEFRLGRKVCVPWGPGSCVFIFLSLLGFSLHSMVFFFSIGRPSLLGLVHVQKWPPCAMHTHLSTQHRLWARYDITKEFLSSPSETDLRL